MPNKATADVRALAQEYGPSAVHKLAALAGLVEGKTPATTDAAQVAALGMLLDRAYGKASQVLAGDPDYPLTATTEVRVTFVRPGEIKTSAGVTHDERRPSV